MQVDNRPLSVTDTNSFPWIIVMVCALFGAVWYLIPHPLVVIGLGLIPVAILFTLRFPVPIGLMFIVFSFFRIHEAIPLLYSLRIPLMLSLATISTLAWHIFISQQIRLYHRPEMVAFLIFFVLVFIGILFAGNRPEAIAYFQSTYIKIGIMTPVLAWLLNEVKHFKLTLFMVTGGGLIIGFVTLFNKINGIGLVEETRVTIGREIGSVLGDPNDLALVLLFPFSFAISLLMTQGLSLKFRALGLIATITLFCAIIVTQSRGGLLGILSVVGIVAYRRVKSKTLFFGVGAIATLALFVLAGISGRQSGGAAEEGLDESAMGRLHAWEAAFGMAVDNPVTGVGINNFYFNYFYYSKYWDGLNHAVHSTWFGVLAETGFIGLTAFLTMVIITFKASRNTLKTVTASGNQFSPTIRAISEGNLAGVVAFCVSGTFLTQGFTWPLYILIALTAAVAQFVENKGAEYD
ncbi:MAG: putative O-glycosylation ligase (exosortase A-associated) [Psychromonas sp.]|jgi:probable O-glycosylation ligase (exosortase A-associated)|uniref:O-antigen ligase family protein n=1 Tax=Psychromonas sp. TaxID=1884585 RepID=UPI0039E4433F